MPLVAIIPARGGSKRIPRKNIKAFMGLPMIAHSIKTALASKLFERVVVSTDDQEIAAIARRYGAQTPFERPADLADDFAPTLDVIAHAVQALAEGFDGVCCIYATAPFMTAEDLKESYKQWVQADVSYVFSAASLAYPFQRSFKLRENNRVEMFFPGCEKSRSQDLHEAYHDAGQFYWASEQTFLQKQAIFTPSSQAYLLPRHRVQDIDSAEDWLRAEMMFDAWQRMGRPEA